MTDGKTQDRLDDLLTDYFRPAEAPPDLARRIARAAHEVEGELLKLEKRLGIQATARGG